MPDINVQIVIAVIVALVLIAAIVWGRRRVRIKAGGIEASVEDQERKVNVADEIRLRDVKVRNVVGSRVEGGAAPATDVSVMRKADVQGGEIVDIVGEEIRSAPPKTPEKTPEEK